MSIREILIDAIVKHSGDELTFADMVIIAKESEQQLCERIACILEWYDNQLNNC